MTQIVECVPNFSEGRDQRVLSASLPPPFSSGRAVGTEPRSPGNCAKRIPGWLLQP